MQRKVSNGNCQCQARPNNRLHNFNTQGFPTSNSQHKSARNKHQSNSVAACGPLAVERDLTFECKQECECCSAHKHCRIHDSENCERPRCTHSLLVILDVGSKWGG